MELSFKRPVLTLMIPDQMEREKRAGIEAIPTPPPDDITLSMDLALAGSGDDLIVLEAVLLANRARELNHDFP